MNQAAASSSTQRVSWPPSLRDLLAAHMQAVDHVSAPAFPPFGDGKRSFYQVLRDIFDRMHNKFFTSAEEKEQSEMVFNFMIQLMEDSCQKSFLKQKERERLKAIFTRKHAHPGVTRKRKDDDTTGDVEKPHYTLQLPADYILRFVAALPLLVDTFLNFCGGGGMSRVYLECLWQRVDVVLRELEGSTAFYSPIVDYQPS